MTIIVKAKLLLEIAAEPFTVLVYGSGRKIHIWFLKLNTTYYDWISNEKYYIHTIFREKIIQRPYHNVGKCAVELYQAKLFNNQLYSKLPFIYNMQKIKMLNKSLCLTVWGYKKLCTKKQATFKKRYVKFWVATHAKTYSNFCCII